MRTAVLEKFCSSVAIELWQVQEGTCTSVLSVVVTQLVPQSCSIVQMDSVGAPLLGSCGSVLSIDGLDEDV